MSRAGNCLDSTFSGTSDNLIDEQTSSYIYLDLTCLSSWLVKLLYLLVSGLTDNSTMDYDYCYSFIDYDILRSFSDSTEYKVKNLWFAKLYCFYSSASSFFFFFYFYTYGDLKLHYYSCFSHVFSNVPFYI